MQPDIQTGIDFEVAISILTDIIGRRSLEKLTEQNKEHPDQTLITRLDAIITQFWDERVALRYDNHEEIERILINYAPSLR